MSGTRLYRPTPAQELEVVRFHDRTDFLISLAWNVATAGVVVVLVGLAKAKFTVPLDLGWSSVAYGLGAAAIFEASSLLRRKRRAKKQIALARENEEEFGPLVYRLSEVGFESWQGGDYDVLEWEDVARFELTDESLILRFTVGPLKWKNFQQLSLIGKLILVLFGPLEIFRVVPREHIEPGLLGRILDKLERP